jgi:hypothetical protein
VPDKVGDVLKGHPVGAEQRDERVPQFPWHPAGAQAGRLGDLPELAQHVVTIQRRPDRRREDQAAILPQRPSPQPVGGLTTVVLQQRLHGERWQPKDAPALSRLGVAGDPYGAVHRDRARIEVNLAPPKRPKLLGPQACHHRQDYIGAQARGPGGAHERLRLLQGKALGRATRRSPRRRDHGRHIPADQVADLSMAYRPLQAVTQDLKSASRQPVRQRIEGLLDIPGGELPELDVGQPPPQRLDGVPVKFPGSLRPAAQSPSQSSSALPTV